nr:FRG domain-containing protein [Clostridium gasigenes]
MLERYSSYSEIYFRGQSEEYSSITPSLCRDDGYLKNEGAIFNEATSMKEDEFSKLDTPIQKLAKLQHYGIPTRLVDLSIDPLISLFFAVQDQESSYAGNVYLYVRSGKELDDLSVRILSVLSISTDFQISTIQNKYKQIFTESIGKEQILEALKEPIFIKHCEELKKSNVRLYNQKGSFAICSNEVIDGDITHEIKSIDTVIPTLVIRIPYEYKMKLKRELDEKYGINELSIYPELPSVADYIKEKYKKANFNTNGKYSIIDTQNISHPMAKRMSFTLVLLDQLNIDQIKRIAIEVIEKNKLNNDVVWIYIARNGDDYIMKNWILQGQWINPLLDKNYRPMTAYKTSVEGYYWSENSSYSTLGDYYSKNVFEDDKVLYISNTKIYEEVFNIFKLIECSSINKIIDIIGESKEKINNAYMKLGNLGRSRNKDFNDFLSKYTMAISSIDNIHHWIENDNLNRRALEYQINLCIKDAKKYFDEIEELSQMWAEELNIEKEDYNKMLQCRARDERFKYTQTIPISEDAITITFNVEVCVNKENTFIILGESNLFNDASLMLSVYNQSNKIMGESKATVYNKKFKFETFSMGGMGYENGEYTGLISLSIPSVQSNAFIKLAGVEYENLVGEYVDRTGLGPTVNYTFKFSIGN